MSQGEMIHFQLMFLEDAPMKKVLIIVLVVLVILLAAAYVGASYVIYDRLADVKGSCDEHSANRPDKFALHPTWPPTFDVSPYFMPPYETVRFPSRQRGINIAGWWIPKAPNVPAVILVDGLGGCKNSIAVLVPAGMLWKNGFNVLMLDLRDTGDSDYEDGRSAIGNEEYLDVLGAWDWLIATKGFKPERIGVYANSLGAATALYAFSEEPRVAAIFLNSPFGNLAQILQEELQRNRYPTFLAPGAIIVGRIVAGDNLVAHDPISAVKKAGRRPIFIVHSRADTRIALHHSDQLAAAARAAGVNVTTWFIDKAEHVQAAAYSPEEFQGKMVEFFRGALGK
jgi:dipeptidyl aminopeptidase/acylaminoacyl peptidase